MGRFPWQIVAAVHNTMLVTVNEHRGVVRSTTGLERILRAIKRDGGNADLGFCRQAGFQRCESRVACRYPEAETIAVDNHIDEVRIIKGGSRPLEGGVVELPWYFYQQPASMCFLYKDKSVDLRQIGREFNVRYVLEGSVQRVGARMRVNVQLIEAESGAHLWAERFDKPIADLRRDRFAHRQPAWA